MSFTSTLSVRSRTVRVCSCADFFSFRQFIIIMKDILQSIVKIIIIGSIGKTSSGNRQFQSIPQFSYFQNNEYYVPEFVAPYEEPLPFFYPEERIHSPPSPPPVSTSYKGLNYYPPVPLFRHNENYHPPQISPSIRGYKVSPIGSYNDYPVPYIPFQRMRYQHAQVNLKPHSRKNPNYRPSLVSHHHADIIIKEENYPPYYHDDYNKHYSEDDYSDNYNDEVVPSSKPCRVPYQHFEPNSPCHPLVNKVYGLKAPITILPSRFPPRIEEIIERIQNYFSTYTQQGAANSVYNQTSTSSTEPPTTPSGTVDDLTTTVLNKNNLTNENEKPVDVKSESPMEQFSPSEAPEEHLTSSQPPIQFLTSPQQLSQYEQPMQHPSYSEPSVQQLTNAQLISHEEPRVPTFGPVVVTENAENLAAPEVHVENNTEISLTTKTDVETEKELQTADLNSQKQNEIMPESTFPHYNMQMNTQNLQDKQIHQIQSLPLANSSSEAVAEPSSTLVAPLLNSMSTGPPNIYESTESEDNVNKTENYNAISTTNEVFYSVNENSD